MQPWRLPLKGGGGLRRLSRQYWFTEWTLLLSLTSKSVNRNNSKVGMPKHPHPLAKNSPPRCLLRQQGNGIYVFTLVETGFEDGIVYKIAEAEQLEGTELMVIAQA